MIIGHKKQWQFFQGLAKTGDVASSYLFIGEEKVGKKKVALEWASLLLDNKTGHGSHPDLMIIEPDAKVIKIEQIQDLIWKMSLKPFSAPFKTAIIDQAHLMHRDAQGAFLKTLEEPKGNSVMILISEHPEYLFPTIRSRVQTFKFYPVKQSEIEEHLVKDGVSEREAAEISQLSFGRPGVAIEFVGEPEKLKMFLEKRKKLEELMGSDITSRFQYAQLLSQDPKDLKDLLDVWLGYFRGALLAGVSGAKSSYSLDKLKDILNLIQTTRSLTLTTNVNTRLALEILMLSI